MDWVDPFPIVSWGPFPASVDTSSPPPTWSDGGWAGAKSGRSYEVDFRIFPRGKFESQDCLRISV